MNYWISTQNIAFLLFWKMPYPAEISLVTVLHLKGVDFERYVFRILARTLHLQKKILKIIPMTITPIHKWMCWLNKQFYFQFLMFSAAGFWKVWVPCTSKDLEYTKTEKQQTESERNQFKNCSKWSVRPYPRILKWSYLSDWVIGCGLTAAWIWYTKWFTWDYSWATNLTKRTWNTTFQSKTYLNFGSHRR